MARWNPNLSVLAGMTPQQLQAALTQAQTAYTQLMTGMKAVDISYGQADGSKHVRYTEADMGKLVAFIAELRTQLGQQRRARRPISFIYNN